MADLETTLEHLDATLRGLDVGFREVAQSSREVAQSTRLIAQAVRDGYAEHSRVLREMSDQLRAQTAALFQVLDHLQGGEATGSA